MRKIDLHVHSTASDGTCSPTEVVEKAAGLGLSAIALSDHDTVDGYAEAALAGERLGLEVVPAIEVSTKYGSAVHILGYFIDLENPELKALLDWIVDDRDSRNEQMAQLMAADGLPVDYAQMKQRFGPVIGRPHFARLLVEFGLADSIKDAFRLYVEKGQKYYMPRNILSIDRAVDVIVKAGGIASLAHPFQYRRDDAALRELIEHCMSLGLRAMECRYTGYSREQVEYLEALAEEYGLLKTGGSDFHGDNKPHIALGSGTGELHVPYSFLQELKVNKSEPPV